VRSIEEIITPVVGCPTKYRAIEYGYTNPITQKSFVLGEACYNVQLGQIRFVHTKLKWNDNTAEDLALKVKGINYFHAEHPTSFFKIELMKALRLDELNERLKRIVGHKHNLSIGTRKFIDEEMLTHKQFQPVLKLTWNYQVVNDEESLDNLEQLNEDILGLKAKNVEIYTGTHGTLAVKNKDGDFVDIFLKDNKFPVPKYLWTVVRADNKAVAFAVFNNAAAAESQLQKDTFCTSKCEELTWINALMRNKQYKNLAKGYVLCCELDEFRQTVTEMPNLSGVTGMLV
jgi:DNA/RNA non-specific endonuclease